MESLEDFYATDQRPQSKELHYGVGWRTPRYELFEFSLFWITETKELCALRSPIRDVGPRGPFSNLIAPVPFYSNIQPPRSEELTIEVLAHLGEDEVTELLAGWETQIPKANGFDWVKERLAKLRA